MSTFMPRTAPGTQCEERRCVLKLSTIYKPELIATTAWFASLADYDAHIAFLQAQRPDVKKHFAPPEWTATGLLAALKAQWPRALIFHPKETTLLQCLQGNSRFYIYTAEGGCYYTYGHCCRRQRRLDCPPETAHTLSDLLSSPFLTVTQL